MPENSVLSRMKRKMSECSLRRDTLLVGISLLLIFFLAVFLRTYFGLGEATAYGVPYLVSGGSDSYYHERAIWTAAYEHHSLIHDPMLKYPIGSHNPRPPAYDWSIVVMGYLLAPFLGGNLDSALSYSLIFSSVIWGALTVFPVYLIGKKVFNRRVGLISAFLVATMPAHMQRSQLTYADHDPFVLFFIVLSIYFLLVSLEKLKEKDWVDSWRKFPEIRNGFSAMAKENRQAFLYAGLSGVSAMTVALTWKGFSYLFFIVVIYFLFQVFINVFRGRDTLALTSVAFLSMGMPLIFAFPYYYITNQVYWVWAPAIMTSAILVMGLYFSTTRRLPWTLTIPALIGAIAIAAVGMYYFLPKLFKTIEHQTGYFTVSKLYQTIAEAQAPYISNMIMSFGPVTFFMSLLAILWIIWKMRKKWEPDYVFFVIWSAVSIYMAVSAARFMFNAAPAFAISAAWITYYIIKEADFGSMKKTYRSLSGNKYYAIKKSVKIKHIIVALFLVFMVVMPNVWYAVDAGIPTNEKKQYDLQVYNTMPDFMRPDSSLYNASNQRDLWYFGAFGYQLPTPNQYWPAAWKWFRAQDTDQLPENRPGFLSWWDYGFESIQEGEHPAVADNFQNGYQLAGSFLMAQNETEAISLLIERILDSEYNPKTGEFSERSMDLMHHYLTDEQVTQIVDMYRHPQKYVPQIIAHPEKYSYYDSQMDDKNARYVAVRGILQTYPEEHLVEMLKALEDTTGKRISYFAVDSRLIPFSAQNTGIFYAPAVLSDRRISNGNHRLPYDFYMIYAVTKYGKKYPIDDIPKDERENIDHTEIEYKDMFYNSMIYRNYFGYSPKEAGLGDNGLPGLSQNMKDNIPMPAWNLTHFRVVYRTAYWNPYKDYKNHSDAWQAVSMEEAFHYRKTGQGIVDMSPGTLYSGVTFLEYYEGAIVNGTVETPQRHPVGDVRVTVYDDYGIPHETVKTDSNGHYSILAPFGNVTLIVSNGGSLDKIRLSEKNILNATHFHVERYQAWREKYDMNGDGKWDYFIEKDPVVSTSKVRGNAFLDMNNNGVKDTDEHGLSGVKVTLYGKSLSINYTAVSDSGGNYSFSDIVPGDYGVEENYNGYVKYINATVTVKPSKGATQDVPVPTSSIRGVARYINGNAAQGITFRAYALDSHNEFNFTTDREGRYSVHGVIPGVYQVDTLSDNLTGGNTRFGLMTNSTSTVNISVYPATKLSGYVVLDGRAIPNFGLNFVNYTDVEARRSVITDKNGYFSLKLPRGSYTVTGIYMHGGSRYMLMDHINLKDRSQKTFQLKQAYELRGYIRYKHYYKDNFPISFINSEGARWEVYSIDGNYSAYLPSGTYHMYVAHAFARFPYAYSTWISIPHDRVVNIDLEHGAIIKGKITGVENLPVERARMDFTSEATGDSFRTFSDDRGDYEYYLAPGNYTLTVSSNGYSTYERTIHLSAGDEIYHNVSMVALKSTVSGTVYLNGNPAAGINVSFYGYNSTYNTTTDSTGNYSIQLYGGRYTVIVAQYTDENHTSRYELSHYEWLYVNPYSEGTVKNLTIQKRYLIEGRVIYNGATSNQTYVLYFSNGSVEYPYRTTNGTFKVYLPVGDYIINSTMSSANGIFAIYDAIHASGPENITLKYKEANEVTVRMEVDGKKVTNIPLNVSVENAVKTYLSKNDIYLMLPKGDYTFSVDYTDMETVDNIERNVTYTGSLTTAISSSKTVNLMLSRHIPPGNLTASLYVDSSPSGNTSVILRSEDNGQEYSFVTSSDGTFHASVPMGAYVVYAELKAGDSPYAVMDKITIGEHTHRSIHMDAAAVFSGITVKSDGSGISANISMINVNDQSIQKSFSSNSSGKFRITVPRGNYSVVVSAKDEEYGIQTSYLKNLDVSLIFSKEQNIVLDRINTYKPKLSWDSSQRVTVMPGTDVVYTITVKNAGNTPDKYTFTSSPWHCDFSPNYVELQPSESTTVRVTVHVPSDALLNHEPLTVVATSSASPSYSDSLRLALGVKEVPGVRIENISTSSWLEGNAVYSVEIRNTGNAPNTFSVTPQDRAKLNAMGWDIGLSDSKSGNYSDSVQLSIPANSSSRVYVKLIPIAHAPAYDAKFTILVQSANGASDEKTLIAPLPSLEIKPDITVSGENVTLWNPQKMDMTPIYWALGIVGVLAAIYIIGRKKGAIL